MNNILRSKYPYSSSTIYNVTASLTDNFTSLNMFERIQKARSIIFTFDYPTPYNISDDDFKYYFETMFISKYIDYYFKQETFEAFQIALYSKMLEIMPVYNAKLSNFFYDKKDEMLLNKTETVSEGNAKSNNTTESKNNTVIENENINNQKVINSSFPSNLNRAGNNIGNVNYADTGSLTEQKNNATGTNETINNSETDNTSENYNKSVTVSGNLFENYIKFDEHFKSIFSDLMGEFKPLFSMIIHY